MSDTLAVARREGYLTIGDVLNLELPHWSEEDQEYALWEWTGWPCFWPTDEPVVVQLRRQLADVRNGVSHGMSSPASEEARDE